MYAKTTLDFTNMSSAEIDSVLEKGEIYDYECKDFKIYEEEPTIKYEDLYRFTERRISGPKGVNAYR